MAERGRPKQPLVLSEEERLVLERLCGRRKTAQALALRARIVLACASEKTNKAVAAELKVTPATVGKWRGRFVERRLDGLFDEPRPGHPRSIADDRVEAVIVKTLEEKPADATHWSTRSMTKAMGMSQTSISLIWRAFGLQPHRAENFKLSTDPLFVDKVKDIIWGDGNYDVGGRWSPRVEALMAVAERHNFRCQRLVRKASRGSAGR